MKKIYIIGKLNDDAVGYIKNLHKMVRVSEIIRKMGFAVYVPGIDFLLGVIHGDWTYEDYFENSQPWLDVSDGIFVLDNWKESKGSKKEIARAKKKKIPTFYKLNDLLEWKWNLKK